MERIEVAEQMMVVFKDGFNTISDTLARFNGQKKEDARNDQEVYENPDELGYQVRA